MIAGYWTHAGYVNWDTGYGFNRWHQVKKFGLSQQALIGIATAPALAPHRDAPAWAKGCSTAASRSTSGSSRSGRSRSGCSSA